MAFRSNRRSFLRGETVLRPMATTSEKMDVFGKVFLAPTDGRPIRTCPEEVDLFTLYFP